MKENLSTEKLASSGARKTGLPTKITPGLRQKLPLFSDKNYPPTRQKLTPNLARPVAPQRVPGPLNI